MVYDAFLYTSLNPLKIFIYNLSFFFGYTILLKNVILMSFCNRYKITFSHYIWYKYPYLTIIVILCQESILYSYVLLILDILYCKLQRIIRRFFDCSSQVTKVNVYSCPISSITHISLGSTRKLSYIL